MNSEDTFSREWREAVKAIKSAILQSQYRAAKGVNREQLSLYFGIGCYISEHSRKGFWGTRAIERISEQLQKELPGLRGFGVASIKNMRQFYESWAPYFNSVAMTTELPQKENRQDIEDSSNSLTAVSELLENSIDMSLLSLPIRYPSVSDFAGFLEIGFTHHMIILRHTATIEERLFYIRQAYQSQWNKHRLSEMLKTDLYHHQATLPNNFSKTMPDSRTALQAIETFKDEYLLDFINVEELGERDKADIDEREVEQAIVHNVKNFIMTFGRDFTFVGNQYHIEKFGHTSYPDLLFYNRELAALVVVELKRGEFKPAYLGQLSAYLRILDTEVKKPFENPSIGIILCKQADKSYVEFLIQGYENPMGVATYKTAEDVRKVLPSEEELRRVMDEKD